jgi:hypothetical protein
MFVLNQFLQYAPLILQIYHKRSRVSGRVAVLPLVCTVQGGGGDVQLVMFLSS